MSFVLDALKLSEKRRSRFARPVYAHPPPLHRRSRRRRWLFALGVAPIVAGVFLAWRLVAPPSPVSLPAAATGADMRTPAESQAVQANLAIAAKDGPGEPRDLDSATPGGAPAGSSAGEQLPAHVSTRVAATEPAPVAQPPGPIDLLPLETAPPDWPALTLQMLFYSPERGRSFVQINGRNYRVGESLDDGPEVLEIAPHAVTLAHRGKKVLLAMDR